MIDTKNNLLKNISPGESMKWQQEWDMTNKEREKLTSGKGIWHMKRVY